MTTAAVLSPANLVLVRIFIAVATLLAFTFSVPEPAKAATLTDAQVKEVVDLLASYEADTAVIRKVQEVLVQSQRHEDKEDNSGKFPGASACGFLMKNLKRGHQGEEVKQLQEYLKNTGDFSDDATGFFGPKTEEALKKIQARFDVVSSGDADSTGFGALGPRTRNILMMRCKEGLTSAPKPDTATSTNAYRKPSCTLTASDREVAAGETVTLSWTSKNATKASVTGETNVASGSVEVTLEETTTFIKTFSGPGGEAKCDVTVEVDGTNEGEKRKEMVWNTNASLLTANTIDAIGSGVTSAITAYFSFFGVRF